MTQINALIAGVGGPQPPAWDYNEAKAAGLRNRLGEMQLESAQTKMQDEREFRPMRNEMEAMKYLRDISPMITWENYSASRQHNININKINPAILPDPQQFVQQAAEQGVSPKAAFDKWHEQSFMTLDQKLKEAMQGERLKSAEEVSKARIEAATGNMNTRLDAISRENELRAKHAAELVELRATLKEPKEPDMNTIYGPEGQTKRVPITKGKEYTPPTGWSLKAPDKESIGYTPQQKVDDTRQYYSMKMKSLLDPMGIGIREGKEGEYNILMQELADDINAVQAGKQPKYLKTPEGKTMTDDVARDYIKKANGDKEKARALARADGYKF